MTTTSPANWYPDPHDPAQMRYWDGQRWTEHVSQGPPVIQSQASSAQPVQPIRAEPAPTSAGRRIPLFGARGVARDLAAENEHLRASLEASGALTLAEAQQQTVAAQAELRTIVGQIDDARRRQSSEAAAARTELDALRRQVLDVRHAINVQEFGLYDFEHPAEASAALAADLARVRAQIKETVSSKRAVTATSNFTFDGSVAKGRKFVESMSKTMLSPPTTPRPRTRSRP
ncbi:DUF2510 domain-containing protein [Cellulomonas oligotrophica]|uniref:DUF2510 domain-containing protein n=1 Tax=Cellulomonas oligotrophica TaxID=931536 RepID=A0A7Y9JW85_9CELL|nr:DUF2510 domain-containing protein [Cellulomonas oligotrophica]NYD84591.1 hypothetical protein [Cellulomonas oligotrophica]GIG31658.1 hypothetical protein Col01nite_08170 [Cellulomonas oligotrophica]